MNDENENAVSPEQEQIEKKLSEAFHLLCDAFPEPMQLCHKSHRVIAVNPAAEKYGRTVGQNCARGCPGFKAGLCRHKQMMDKGVASWFNYPGGDGRPNSTAFWIPVTGYPDYYFHFGIGVTIDYAATPTEE